MKKKTGTIKENRETLATIQTRFSYNFRHDSHQFEENRMEWSAKSATNAYLDALKLVFASSFLFNYCVYASCLCIHAYNRYWLHGMKNWLHHACVSRWYLGDMLGRFTNKMNTYSHCGCMKIWPDFLFDLENKIRFIFLFFLIDYYVDCHKSENNAAFEHYNLIFCPITFALKTNPNLN